MNENYRESNTDILTSFKEIEYYENDRLTGYTCENCGFSFTTYWIQAHKFCYNCGAKNKNWKELRHGEEKQ